jgi:hypothetical protein
MGGSKTTTGAGNQFATEQSDSPLTGLLAAKGSYDSVQDSIRGGKNIKNWWNNDSDAFFDKTGQQFSQSFDSLGTGLNNFFMGKANLPAFQQQALSNEVISNALGGGGLRGGLGKGSLSLGSKTAELGQGMNFSQAELANINPSISGGMPGVDPGLIKAGAPLPPTSNVTGLNSISTGPKAAGAGVNGFGAAMSGLGVGMNVADMFDQGVTFGNATGAIGSGILGASALGIGAANAWNPVGWALLAASAADSIFDIF